MGTEDSHQYSTRKGNFGRRLVEGFNGSNYSAENLSGRDDYEGGVEMIENYSLKRETSWKERKEKRSILEGTFLLD